MPILHNVRQGSDAWDRLRLGIPTSSVFDRVWTAPSKKFPRGQKSRQWEDLAFTLLAERYLGYKMATYVSPHMEDGKEFEEEAADWYGLTTGRDVELIGFITNADKTLGCSPDRLVGEDGLLEIKVPKPNTQMKYLIKGTIAVDYWPQLQGQLWLSERHWVDIVAYRSLMPRKIIRVERDEPYIDRLAAELSKVVEYIEGCWAKILEMAGAADLEPQAPAPGVSLARLRASLEASLAQEDKARSTEPQSAAEVVGDSAQPRGTTAPGEAVADIGAASPPRSEPATADPQPSLGGGGSAATPSKADPPTEYVAKPAPPVYHQARGVDPAEEDKFWEEAARTGDYKLAIADKNIATTGRDQMMNKIRIAPSLAAMRAFYKANEDRLDVMSSVRLMSRADVMKAFDARKKQLEPGAL